METVVMSLLFTFNQIITFGLRSFSHNFRNKNFFFHISQMITACPWRYFFGYIACCCVHRRRWSSHIGTFLPITPCGRGRKWLDPGMGGGGGVLPYKIAPFWSENGYGFRGNYGSVWTYFLFQFQMNTEKERVIYEFEVDFKKSFIWRSNQSNDDIIS